MSSALEPPPTAKVVLHTTSGPIELELWARETPRACRNFLQHCLDGTYDNTLFHRVVPGFMVQAGDPTGTGHGGVSIYHDTPPEHGFPSEFNARLRFNRRGLLGNAEAAEANESGTVNDNSQFFITLAATPELQRKHTLFGRVVGDTIYNVLKIGDAALDKDDRPLYPTRVTSAEVVLNYFEDMTSRRQQKTEGDTHKKLVKKKGKAKARVKISYGDDDEGDGEGDKNGEAEEKVPAFKMRPAHEILHDSRLSNTPAAAEPQMESADAAEPVVKKLKTDARTSARKAAAQPPSAATSVPQSTSTKDTSPPAPAQPVSEFDKINAEISAMKASIKRISNRDDDDQQSKKNSKKQSALAQQREMYLQKSKNASAASDKGLSRKRQREVREAETLAMLAKFTNKLHAASREAPLPPLKQKRRDDGIEVKEDLCSLHNLPDCQSCIYYDNLSDGEDDIQEFMGHTFEEEKKKRRSTREFKSPSPPPMRSGAKR
ncbi:cyclophilin-like domain-containing protein [Limtongia smithiae]|uniref:cyclophilin-like domain-containing protein n=1 Tax=Limtongia smithiae TaxID=1125753 RepID=UPI0034CD29BA